MYKDYIQIRNVSRFDPIAERHLFYQDNAIKEISISLFGECNMSCEFCIGNQRHHIKHPDNFDHILPLVEQVIASTTKKSFSVILYGGELFHDGIPDSLFDQYRKLVQNIRSIMSKNNRQCTILFSTNLVHKKTERVINLLRDCEINTINCSFDLAQRFTNDKLLDRFMSNVRLYEQQHFELSIGFILTKQNIEQFYNKGRLLPYFEQLYDKHTIYFDYYHPNDRDSASVDERMIGEFLCYLEQHYPNIDTLQNLREHTQSGCSCPASFIIDDVLINQCCDFKDIAKRYALNKRCFTCQYKPVCSHPCIRMMSDNKDCFVKIYYDYLQQSKL